MKPQHAPSPCRDCTRADCAENTGPETDPPVPFTRFDCLAFLDWQIDALLGAMCGVKSRDERRRLGAKLREAEAVRRKLRGEA